ncbi:hypothetical protein A0H76_235 [Hepatospora eriocheir]|uniref:Uncharacterized protein n=1 Tax=Hepatospora eriocheir TaxID=1081669 RepID=A0A1X0QJ12_9MICR|nr:hypothetical protein A0H76_235 [Hepatospora eriocheir]
MSNQNKEGYVWTFFPVHKGGNDKTIVVRYGRDKCLTHSMALKKCKFEDERIGLFNLDCEFYFDIFPFNTEKSLEKLEYYLNKLKNSNNKTEERIKQAECTPYKSPNPCLPSDKCDEIKKNYPVIYLPEKNDVLKEALMKTVGDGSSRFIN